MADSQPAANNTYQHGGISPVSTIPAGCAVISKKQIFYLLRPNCRKYTAKALREFFTKERMERCGISPADFPRIRTFSPDASAAIRRELHSLVHQ